jgi:DNA-binding winged helix-turn-helix (wHTH) protein/TolB-like protein
MSSIRFPGGSFDPSSGELAVGTSRTRLEPQPARALALLLERRGQVVSREELARRIWPAETHVDFDRGLNYCVAQLRQAFGDSAESPRYIETLPRRGYRFLAAEAPEEAPPPGPPSPSRWTKGAAAAALLAVAALAALAAWGIQRSAAPPTPVLAVMLFDNESGRAEADRLARNLTDGVVERLARTPTRWVVIGNAAVLRTRRSFRDVPEVAASLGAGYVVLGQLQEVDGRLRVIAHLLRADDQTHLWANRFALGPGGEAALEDEVAGAVRRAAETVLTPSSPDPHRP